MIPGRSPGGALGPALVALLVLGGRPAPAQPRPPAKSLPGKAEAPETKPGEKKLSLEDVVALFNETHAVDRFSTWDQKTGEVTFFYQGGVTGTFPWRQRDGKVEMVHLSADRVLVLTSLLAPPRKEGPEKPAEAEPGKPEGGTGPGAAKPAEGKSTLAAPRLYAEGNVRIETRGLIIETDAFFFDDEKRRGVAVGVRAEAQLASLALLPRVIQRSDFSPIDAPAGRDPLSGLQPEPVPAPPIAALGERSPEPPRTRGANRWARILAIRAESLRILDADHFEGEDIIISNCDFAAPHFGLRSGAGRVYPAPPKPGAPEPEGEAGGSAKSYIVGLQTNRLEITGVPVVVLPPVEYNTEWGSELPLRNIRPGHSSKFGARVDAEWNLNWFLRRTGLTRLEPADLFLGSKWSRLGFATDYRSARGFLWGPDGIYGLNPRHWKPDELRPTDWTFFGEGNYFAIHDEGKDRSSDTQFEDPDRHWAHLAHRQSIPYLGVLEVEYSDLSDRNFLNEYFERIAKQEKEEESLFYLRRQFRDNIALSGLYKYRTNDFETVEERLPEGKLFVLEQPIARTGLYSGLLVQGARLNEVSDEALSTPSVRVDRFDAQNEWAYPTGLGRWLRLRPFAAARLSEFDRGIDPSEGSIERESLAAGVAASQEYSRIFHFPSGGLAERWFGFTQLKHLVVPKVTYRNTYWNNVEPSELVPLDEVETVSTDERIGLSLRNDVLVRGPAPVAAGLAGAAPRPPPPPAAGESSRLDRLSLRRLPQDTRYLLDSEVSMDWFTHPERDNGGKRFSLLDVDATFLPAAWLSLHQRSFFDPNEDLRFEMTDSGVTVVPVPDGLRVTVGERFTRGLSSYTYSLWSIDLSKRYLLDLYYAYDFQLGRQARAEVHLIRVVHEWAFEFVYSFDAGQSNHSISVNVQPVNLFQDLRARRDRTLAHER